VNSSLGTEPQSLTEQSLVSDWLGLLELGPRFLGSVAESRARGYLLEKLSGLPLAVREQSYEFAGWELVERVRLTITAPTRQDVEAMAFIHCAHTPVEGLRGRLQFLGYHWVIRCFDWMRFAILNDDDKLIGYLSARPDGPAIPQSLDRDNAVVPHFIVGSQAYDQLSQWVNDGTEVAIEGTINCRDGERGESANIVASHEPLTVAPFRVVVCAHLDSMWTCPGANDNGGGVTAVLALARAVCEAPLAFAVDFLFFTGEEWDLLGSRAYVASLTEEDISQIRLVINLDGIAETGEALQIWSGSENLEYQVIQCVQDYARPQGHSIRHTYTFPPRLGSDHVPFHERGRNVVAFTGFEMVRYHTRADVFRPELGRNLEYVTRLIWHLLRCIGTDVEGPIFRNRVELMTVRDLEPGAHER
jgi:hypothetical protein